MKDYLKLARRLGSSEYLSYLIYLGGGIATAAATRRGATRAAASAAAGPQELGPGRRVRAGAAGAEQLQLQAAEQDQLKTRQKETRLIEHAYTGGLGLGSQAAVLQPGGGSIKGGGGGKEAKGKGAE